MERRSWLSPDGKFILSLAIISMELISGLATKPIRLGENVSSSSSFAYSPSSLFSSTNLAHILPLLPPLRPHPCYHQILQLHRRLGESQRLV